MAQAMPTMAWLGKEVRRVRRSGTHHWTLLVL